METTMITHCSHCRGELTAGCEYCMPQFHQTGWDTSNPTEQKTIPLTDEEIKLVREILRNNEHMNSVKPRRSVLERSAMLRQIFEKQNFKGEASL